ncbi:MAG: helix-turn-helix transcriptional regulator [Phenylobacterium sp.]|uniref:helix-turn-helix domain-containing protein n=2 Tax=Phenylobacterium sp. TaxID=1871053 RepID=UPI0025FDBF87|nr:helix-turn-helix transcriptional regulator [Phenylobacterium sp.]MCA6224583.1 helix-turn-helix transcriptional regulator [Phenylobacterium sp.]MCA6226382.1 helix-turn-helix transcriptional regulator [Phenylobacterium sp.]MCA6232053.1 helix-turn-helix transcriptional regulator [Phenylobacterium sp.]MCA6233936.1 helix-turn-helix transcriptional regulator [Phenylobacterium sp.]MCA6253334.1 helix-turn-helix transcriptional regulator [Phenylobacterium sp.]
MSDPGFRPVRHDGKEALERAMQRPGFKEAWEAGADEYAALRSLLEARKQAGLTQEEIAIRMGTSKSAVSRLESSLRDPKHSPTFETIRRYAKACGKRVEIQLV